MGIKVFLIFNVLLSFSSSKTDIPDCNYYDTVDLSHIEKQNGSYVYEGIIIPANLTGEYDYRRVLYGGSQPQTKHLRGCVCQVKPCIRFCCPRKNMLPNGRCSDGFEEELSRSNPYLNVTFKDGSVETQYITNQTLMRTRNYDCDEMLGLNAGEYTLFENGTIYINSLNSYWNIEEYCFYPHSDFQETLWIVVHHCFEKWKTADQIIAMTTIVCLILTIAIYLYVNQLRNVLGKSLVSSFLCNSVVYFLLGLENASLLDHVCSLAGYTFYFINIALYFWSSIISYHLWMTLTTLKSHEPENRFLVYSAVAWIPASILTGIIIVINQVWENDPHHWNGMPIVGLSRCLLIGPYLNIRIYYTGILITVGIFNWTMFILTIIHILKVKRELKYFKERLEFDKETYMLFLRLSVIMGLSWMLFLCELIKWKHKIWTTITKVVNYLNTSIGILDFVLLILKRSTLRLLMDRIRGRG